MFLFMMIGSFNSVRINNGIISVVFSRLNNLFYRYVCIRFINSKIMYKTSDTRSYITYWIN